MIPVSLTLQGLYSYQARQTIDFEKLLHGGVFGIFGKTGSGKSTILEAITLALYGEVERLNSRDNINYNLMNQKSNELYVDFTFKNYDEKIYRFKVSGKRNKKDYNKVESFERSAYINENDEWLPLGKITAENILGLSYDYFRRTTIVPQGKFEEFISLTSSKRTEMLSEIFQLGKYEYFDKVSELEKRNNEEIKLQTGKLSHYENVSEDILVQKRNDLVGIEKNLAEKQTEHQAKTILLNEQIRIKQLVDERDEKLNVLKSLAEKEIEFNTLKKKIKDYEYCIEHFKPSLDKRKELLSSIQSGNEKLTKSFQELDAKKLLLIEKEKTFAIIQQQFDKLDDYKVELNDCKLISEALKLQADVKELQVRIKNGEEKTVAQTIEVNELLAEINKLNSDIADRENLLPDLVELTKAGSWFENYQRLKSEAKEAELHIDKHKNLLTQTKQALLTKLHQRFGNELVFDSNVDFDIYENTIINYQIDCNKKIESLEITLSDYKLKQKLSEYSLTLKEGEPCQLCGAIHHPNPLGVDNVNEHLSAVVKEKETWQHRIQFCLESSKEINRAQTLCQSHQTQMESASAKYNDQQNDLVLHQSLFSWKGFGMDDDEKFIEIYSNAKIKHDSLRLLRLTLEGTRKTYDKALEKNQTYKDALITLNQRNAELNSQRNTYLQQVRSVKFNESIHSTDFIAARIKELDKTILETESDHKKIKIEVDRLILSIALLEQQHQSFKTELESLNKRLGEIENDIKDCLAKSSYIKHEEVEAILKEKINLNDQRNLIHEFDIQFANAKADVIRLDDLINNQEFDSAQFEILTEQTQALHQAVQHLNAEKLRGDDAIKQLESDLQLRKTLEENVEQLKLREENIKILKSLFKGNGFVNYVSSVHLRRLCAVANLRYSGLVHDQYHLELSDKNDFMICDHLSGGKIRDVKTMSGGQKFQVSLSLALALSDQVQQQSKAKQNFFFLDEGFGTLDKESLQLVFDSLKTLRKDNRIVGIISHVEELKQEIDYHIEVTNKPHDGSHVTYSWNN